MENRDQQQNAGGHGNGRRAGKRREAQQQPGDGGGDKGGDAEVDLRMHGAMGQHRRMYMATVLAQKLTSAPSQPPLFSLQKQAQERPTISTSSQRG